MAEFLPKSLTIRMCSTSLLASPVYLTHLNLSKFIKQVDRSLADGCSFYRNKKDSIVEYLSEVIPSKFMLRLNLCKPLQLPINATRQIMISPPQWR